MNTEGRDLSIARSHYAALYAASDYYLGQIAKLEDQLAAANKRAEALVGHLTAAERDLALALNTEENLRLRVDIAERALAEARESASVAEALNRAWRKAVGVDPKCLRCHGAGGRWLEVGSPCEAWWPCDCWGLKKRTLAELTIQGDQLVDAHIVLEDCLCERNSCRGQLVEAKERDLDALQADIGVWADHTFPSHYAPDGHPNPRGPIMHLTHPEKGEIWELVRAFEAGQPLKGEVADCITLLLTIAHLSGFSALEATRAKLAKNRQRQWGQPDPDGIVEHVQEEDVL